MCDLVTIELVRNPELPCSQAFLFWHRDCVDIPAARDFSEQIMSVTLEKAMSEPAAPKVTQQAKHAKPSMAIVNFWLDVGLFVNLIFIMWVSVILQFVFPPPTES